MEITGGVKHQAQNQIRRWRENSLVFVNEVFGVELDHWQREALTAYQDMSVERLRIALKACAGPGKTASLAWIGWHFLLCQADYGEHPKGACVSITKDNLKDNLWPEFSKWQERSEILKRAFTWTKQRIFANDHPETWFLSARSWSKKANADEQGRTLSGLHSKNVLVLVDESGEVPISVLKAGEQALSNCKFGRIVQAGNPTSLHGMLYSSCSTLRDQWTVITITGDPEDPRRSPRIDIEWARDQIKQYGREDPWVQAYILGQFPAGGLNTLLSVEDVEAAMARQLRPEQYQYSQKRLGIDVAREGDDSTVIFGRQGLKALKPVTMRTQYGPDISARVISAKLRWGSEVEFFDDTGGWASSAIDSLIMGGYSPVPVNFSGKAIDPRYFNKRSEMWFNMAAWVKRGGALPQDPILLKELTIPSYTFKEGKFLLQPKEQIKKLLRFSPDRADALALTFAQADQPTHARHPGLENFQKNSGLKSHYDPNIDETKDETTNPIITNYDPFFEED